MLIFNLKFNHKISMQNLLKKHSIFLGCLMLAWTVFSCIKNKSNDQMLVVADLPQNQLNKALEIRQKTPIKLADGLEMKLWASDTLVQDPIAISVDDAGNVYFTSTNRQKNSEFDIRGHQNWMTASISLQNVEDRRRFLKETFAIGKSKENEWLNDLNQDGEHDWRDLTVEKEEIWKIEDRNKDGLADLSTRIFSGFNEEITDVAGALLVREKDIFVGVGPDFWRLTDSNRDGLLDKKTSISHGYAVHVGFGGHGMSGAIEGPDGRIYWGIGDIGANITAKNGKKYEYPNEGVIVRANPDGSDFEVFAAGLRNTHEFVFDQYGNIITSDNDGDHPGESERLMHVVEGSDAGWRANWQYGKYTDAKNNKYKVWMDEKLFKPRWEGQAAYIIPPIMNFHNGPAGMQYNPGTALGKAWLNRFFLVEFVGSPSRSHVWSFGLKPQGVSFVLDSEKDMLSGILPTGIKFGPDGALYVADWINGWDTKNYGRIWKLDVTENKQDLIDERQQTQAFMQLKYELQTEKMLAYLLAYSDMRIRQKAQFELAKRGNKGFVWLSKVLAETDNQLAKVHAIWGIGQLARNQPNKAAILMSHLNTSDSEVLAQLTKTLGDLRYLPAAIEITKLLAHSAPRVKFYAAEALGRMSYGPAAEPILKMLAENNDEDVYLRHAGVLALARMHAETQVVALANHPSKALRTAAVLVLRKLKSEQLALFLNDTDEFVVTEAARGINDDTSIPEALPALAELLNKTKWQTEPILRRALNAAQRVGSAKCLESVISFAKKTNVSHDLRTEAIATLATWAEPSVLDRVDGRFRGYIKRESEIVKAAILPHITPLLNDKNPETLVAIAQLVANLNMDTYGDALAELFYSEENEKVKVAIIEALSALNYPKIAPIVKSGMAHPKSLVRTAAIGSLAKLTTEKETLSDLVKPIFDLGLMREKQKLINVLGTIPLEKTETVLSELIDMFSIEKLEKELLLELTEAVNQTQSKSLIQKLADLNTSTNWLDEFKLVLFGGNASEGRKYFNTNSTGQCVRCHSIGVGTGGTVGPPLEKIGTKLTREMILEALVHPSARLSPGYGQMSLTLLDGQEITGMLTAENEQEITLQTSDAEPTKIAVSRIAKRENMPSSMPPMSTLMSKREMRDVVEFLCSLK
jgi:quinoprotein glucose dehydrogenase